MNGRRIFRKYARYKGKEAKSFIEIIPQWYDQDTLITEDSKGRREETMVDYKEMVHLMIRNIPNIKKD